MKTRCTTANGKVIFTRVTNIVSENEPDDYARWVSVGHDKGTRPLFSIARYTFKTDRRTGRTTEVAPYYRAYVDSNVLDYHGNSEWSTFEDACVACDRKAYRED